MKFFQVISLVYSIIFIQKSCFSSDSFIQNMQDPFANVGTFSSSKPTDPLLTFKNPTTIDQANKFFDHVKSGETDYQSALVSYANLNTSGKKFNIGPGIAMSQTVYNTAQTLYNPNESMPYFLYNILDNIDKFVTQSNIVKLFAGTTPSLTKRLNWITSRFHKWYALTCLPAITCHNSECTMPAVFENKTIAFENLNKLEEKEITNLLSNLASNIPNNDKKLIPTRCPFCASSKITLTPQVYKQLTPAYQQALIEQIQYLDVFNQPNDLPVCRVSLEIADLLIDGTTQIDSTKLQNLKTFVADLKNPLIFLHHYANPMVKPDLFANPDQKQNEIDIQWFADICTMIVGTCTNVTHVCPISQPMALAQKVSRDMQPPFSIKIPFEQYIKNIAQAQKQASISMKKIRPDIKVLLSHQWKPMKTTPGMFGLKNPVKQYLFADQADKRYNQGFVGFFKDQLDHFDGIALSVYEAMFFDSWNPFNPSGDNCSGALDPHAALEAINKIYQAFGKDFYVVETGCNCIDPQRKIDFVNMILHVCNIAANMDIPVKTCFFWGLTDDINFYREWDKAPGSTHFGFYSTLDPANPTGSIKPYGQYMKKIIQSVYPTLHPNIKKSLKY